MTFPLPWVFIRIQSDGKTANAGTLREASRCSRKEGSKRPIRALAAGLAIVANWQSTQSVSPKLVCIIDDCAMSTLYERLKRQEYQAVKDGHRTRIITESIKKRRDGLQLFKSNSATAATRGPE
jgi:hypothetical protein